MMHSIYELIFTFFNIFQSSKLFILFSTQAIIRFPIFRPSHFYRISLVYVN